MRKHRFQLLKFTPSRAVPEPPRVDNLSPDLRPEINAVVARLRAIYQLDPRYAGSALEAIGWVLDSLERQDGIGGAR